MLKRIHFNLTIFTTGAVVLIVEILGTRVIAPFYGATIFVWSAMIVVTLGALALGYWAGGVLADRRPAFAFFYTLVFAAGFVLLLVKKIDRPLLMFSDHFGLKYGPFVGALLLFFIPLFLLGLLSPFAVRLLTFSISLGERRSIIMNNKEESGRKTGRVLALSTFGSVTGALAAAFWLIPSCTVSGIFLFLGLTLCLMAVSGFIVCGPAPKKVLFILYVMLLFYSVFLNHGVPALNGNILYETESFYGDIKMTQDGPFKCLYVNASAQSCLRADHTTDSRHVLAIQSIAESIHPKKVLLLGTAAGAALSGLDRRLNVDAVELDPRMVAAAKEHNLFCDFPARVFYDDARRYVRTTHEKYDFVIIDIAQGNSIPGYLYSRESLGDMRRILNEGGVLFVHLSLNPAASGDMFVASLAATLRAVFGDYREVSYIDNPLRDVNLLASRDSARLEHINVFPYVLRRSLDLRGAAVVTDDHNFLDYAYTPHAFEFRNVIMEAASKRDILFVR